MNFYLDEWLAILLQLFELMDFSQIILNAFYKFLYAKSINVEAIKKLFTTFLGF